MKNFFVYVCVLFLIVFMLPILFTKKRQAKNIEDMNTIAEENIEVENYPKYDYKKYAAIKLYHSKTGSIEDIPIDEYLYGVVSAEMPADFEMEALKAQAVVARTYTLYQIINSNSKHGEADLCDDYNCCQAWISKDERLAKWDENEAQNNWNKIVNAVNSTQGEIITYEGKPIDAFFHSNSGGITETASNVWGGQNFPYLQSVETSGEEGYEQYSSEVELSYEELFNKLKEKYKDIEINFDDESEIQILEKTESGRVKTIKFGNIQISGTEARKILGLKSTNFTFMISNNKIVFTVIGYGHGVGMSQTGADSLAKQGKNYQEIVKHYFSGVEIQFVEKIFE